MRLFNFGKKPTKEKPMELPPPPPPKSGVLEAPRAEAPPAPAQPPPPAPAMPSPEPIQPPLPKPEVPPRPAEQVPEIPAVQTEEWTAPEPALPQFPEEEIPEMDEEPVMEEPMEYEDEEPAPTVAPKQLFVHVDEYKEIFNAVGNVKSTIKNAEALIEKLTDLKTSEEKLYQDWKSKIEDVEKKLTQVDTVISKGRGL